MLVGSAVALIRL